MGLAIGWCSSSLIQLESKENMKQLIQICYVSLPNNGFV